MSVYTEGARAYYGAYRDPGPVYTHACPLCHYTATADTPVRLYLAVTDHLTKEHPDAA